MNFLNVFESHVANIFGAARAPFSFKKLAKQAAREMEDQTLVVNGVNTAPALYTILISNDDDPLMAPYYPQLSSEVCEFVRSQAEKKKYVFVGEPLVRFMVDPSLKPGKFSVFAENVDAATLTRLFEEERAYQKGLSQNMQAPAKPRRTEPASQQNASYGNAGAGNGAGAAGADPFAASAAPIDPFAPSPNIPLAGTRGAAGAAGGVGGASIPDPFAPQAVGAADPIPVPRTVSRDQLVNLANPASPSSYQSAGASMAGAASAAASMNGAAAGMQGAAAGAAAGAVGAGAASIAGNMAQARTAQPQAQPQVQTLAHLVDVVTGDTYDVNGRQCVIGRERATTDISLRDPNVSRRHAQLIYNGSDWTIEDLNSTNGTLVNNRRINRCPLRSGDLITFGLSTFEFRG